MEKQMIENTMRFILNELKMLKGQMTISDINTLLKLICDKYASIEEIQEAVHASD